MVEDLSKAPSSPAPRGPGASDPKLAVAPAAAFSADTARWQQHRQHLQPATPQLDGPLGTKTPPRMMGKAASSDGGHGASSSGSSSSWGRLPAPRPPTGAGEVEVRPSAEQASDKAGHLSSAAPTTTPDAATLGAAAGGITLPPQGPFPPIGPPPIFGTPALLPPPSLAPPRKVISSPIPGTGVFVVLREGPHPAGGRAFPALLPQEQERMKLEAYEAVLAVCNSLVPGDAVELMDGLMETTGVYRKRYGFKKNLFDLRGDETVDEASMDNLLRLTRTFKTLGGSFWLDKDRYFRKRRCAFVHLARSQRARVIKATYELLMAVGEEFSPGSRLDLMDEVFKHHASLRPLAAAKPEAAFAGAGRSVSMASSEPSFKRRRDAHTYTHAHAHAAAGAPPLMAVAPDSPLYVAAVHILAAHWAQALRTTADGGAGASSSGGICGPLPPPMAPPLPGLLPGSLPPTALPPPPPVHELASLACQYLAQHQQPPRHLPPPLPAPPVGISSGSLMSTAISEAAAAAVAATLLHMSSSSSSASLASSSSSTSSSSDSGSPPWRQQQA